MTEQHEIPNILSNPAIVRELERAIASGKIEITENGLFIPDARLNVGGVFTTGARRAEAVQRAIDDGDSEREWFYRLNPQPGAAHVDFGIEHAHNLVPTLGLNFVLNLIFRSRTQIGTWYYGPYLSTWTPGATAGSNWAGATSGPLATELAAAQFDEGSVRQAATFGTNAADSEITTSAYTTLTLSSAVTSALTWYGLTLNESSTIAYNSTDKILLSAAPRATAMSGLLAGDALICGYEFGATSS
jgi:hypothetical protein